MGLSPGRWLSSYSPGAIIAAKPLPLATLTRFTAASLFRFHQPVIQTPWAREEVVFCCCFLLSSEIFSVHISSSSLLPFLSPSNFLSLHLCFISSHTERSVRDTWRLWLLLIWSISGYFSTLTPSYRCERHLYQAGHSSCGLSRSSADYEGFWGGLLKESRGGLDSFAVEKGETVLRNGMDCGKGDLFGVIVLFFLNCTLALK